MVDWVAKAKEEKAKVKLHKDFELISAELREEIMEAIYYKIDELCPQAHEPIHKDEYTFYVRKCKISGDPSLAGLITLQKDDVVVRVYEIHIMD